MSAAGLPSVQVLLDDVNNGGTWPHDITAYVRLTDGYQITRGRADEQSDIQPGQLSITLDNTDGRFTLGTTGGGYGAINLNRGIRVKATVGGTTSTRFTGYVQAWPVDWPDGSDLFSRVTVTATDAMARWARRTLRSAIEEEVLAASPLAYYTLGEPDGATASADSSGNHRQSLVSTGSGAAIVYGQATGPGTDGLTAAQFAAGKYLTATLAPTATGSIFCTFSTTTAGGTVFEWYTSGAVPITAAIDATGHLTGGYGPATTSAGVVTDGRTHRVVVTWTASQAFLYLDETLIGSSGAGPGVLAGASGVLNVGSGFTGAISHVALFGAQLTSTQRGNLGTAASTGFIERADQRVARLAAYAGGPTTTVLDTAATTVPFVNWSGANVADGIKQAADAEVGTCYVDGTGRLVFHNRARLPLRTTPDFTAAVSSDILDPGTAAQADTQQMVNAAEATRTGDGAPTLHVVDQASVTTHGAYEQSYTFLVTTDDEARARIEWIVATHAQPVARIPQLTLDLMTADTSVQQSALGLDIDSRVQITGWPSQSPVGPTADLVVAGYTESLSLSEWTLQANTVAWALSSAWILEDATYGVLGTTTKLYI